MCPRAIGWPLEMTGIAGCNRSGKVAARRAVEREGEIIGPEHGDWTNWCEHRPDVQLGVDRGERPGSFERGVCRLPKLVYRSRKLHISQARRRRQRSLQMRLSEPDPHFRASRRSAKRVRNLAIASGGLRRSATAASLAAASALSQSSHELTGYSSGSGSPVAGFIERKLPTECEARHSPAIRLVQTWGP